MDQPSIRMSLLNKLFQKTVTGICPTTNSAFVQLIQNVVSESAEDAGQLKLRTDQALQFQMQLRDMYIQTEEAVQEKAIVCMQG